MPHDVLLDRCTATPDASLNPTGTVGTTNCDQDANYGSGCTVIGGDAGTVFNQNGGGVYIMAFEVSRLHIASYVFGNLETEYYRRPTSSACRRRESRSGTTVDPIFPLLSALPHPVSIPPPWEPPSLPTLPARVISASSSLVSR